MTTLTDKLDVYDYSLRSEAGLAEYAARDETSRGRRYEEARPKFRGEYQRDRDRVIHSTAFRRLVYKTQVFVNHEGDLYRTRLTHSIEVAQIARSVARVLGLNEQLVECISLAHDLGHTPFGHAGQDVLNDCMRDYGGFEHNLQSLRVVDELEEKYAGFPGLNLTYESREGILKHCSRTNARQLHELGHRFLEGGQPGLEAQLANLADEIAYNNHDVDDGIRAGLIQIEDLLSTSLFRVMYEDVRGGYSSVQGRRLIYEIVRRMINGLITDVIRTSAARIREAAPKSIEDVRKFESTLIGFSDSMREQHNELKQFLRKNLYQHHKVLRMTGKARDTLRALFNAFFHDTRLLPREYADMAARWENEEGQSGRARAIADYIAGMTDRYAILEYERLFEPWTKT